MESISSSSFNAAKIQPKFKDCSLEDKEPLEFIFTWTKIMTGIVSNIETNDHQGGPELESLLDEEEQLAGVPVLVYANKQDLLNAMTAAEVPRPNPNPNPRWPPQR